MDEKDNKTYELAFLVRNEEDVASIPAFVRQHGGEMTMEPRAKKLAFAYEIKKHKEGVFAYCQFTAPSAAVKDMEHDLNTKPEVLRSMVIASPAAAMAADGQVPMPMGDPSKRRTRVMRGPAAGMPNSTDATPKPAAPKTLSNEALEKKIEEILQ